MTYLISAEALSDVIDSPTVKILDCSWSLDAKDMLAAFNEERIAGAQFFDIEKYSDLSSELVHMAPTPSQFQALMCRLGIKNSDRVIVYDRFGLFSAARVWWVFLLMGHKNIKVLNGGLNAWKAISKKSQEDIHKDIGHKYTTEFNKKYIININELFEMHTNNEVVILDARHTNRFFGIAKEPRPNLKSGHIPNSHSLPFTRLISNGYLLGKSDLKREFANYGINAQSSVITTCGSGITAAIINLALAEIGVENHRLFDGSWAEWGQSNKDYPVELK